MKVVYIVGARPQFIKLAMMHKEAVKHAHIREHVIHSGQHFSYNMSDAFFEQLTIHIPVTNLQIHSLSHLGAIGRTMEALEPCLLQLQPDYVIVFGDTNTTLAGALCGKKLGFPVVHVEAGIRTFDEAMPEETNRYLTDRMAAINFCCTETGIGHLCKEGFLGSNIGSEVYNSGDIMLDAFLHYAHLFTKEAAPLEQPYVLATLHRRRNVEAENHLTNIVAALNGIHKQLPVICPLHPNTHKYIKANHISCDFTVTEPVGYLQMQSLIHHSSFVITDSGGVQREAFFAKKPALILMPQPFWPEVVQHGTALNCNSTEKEITASFERLKTLPLQFDTTVFGDGQAAAKMIAYLNNHYQKRQSE